MHTAKQAKAKVIRLVTKPSKAKAEKEHECSSCPLKSRFEHAAACIAAAQFAMAGIEAQQASI